MEVLVKLAYVRVKEIGVGQGRNSKVYLGRDPQTEAPIAVKEICKQDLDEKGVKDYFAEAKAMFSAEHPENVVPVRYAGENEAGTHICLAMPFYKKGSLQDRISAGPISPREVIRVGLGVLNGLQHIHNARFIHFDVKPSNVLFSDRNATMVADFGQTQAFDPSTGVALTPAMYAHGIPPECFGSKGTVRSDIFQAGATLYRAVNGDPWFQAQKPMHSMDAVKFAVTNGLFPHPEKFLPHVPRALRTAIKKSLAVTPTDRYPSAAVFASELEKIRVEYDWAVAVAPTGEMTWTGTKSGYADVVVSLLKDGTAWRTEVHTRSGRGLRRRGDSDGWWKKGLTQKQAFDHLRQVFRAME